MNYKALYDLCVTHPQFPSVSDADLAIWVNDPVVSNDKDSLPSGEVFATILDNSTEFAALADGDKQMVRDILYVHSGEGVPIATGSPARTTLVGIFGAQSQTIQALATKMVETISRSDEIGLVGEIEEIDITEARRRYE